MRKGWNSPANGLSAEKAHNYEVGTKYDTALFLKRHYFISISMTYFTLKIQRLDKFGATTHQGVELAARYNLSELKDKLDGISVYSTYTATKAVSKKGCS
ncbi:TonB-dependent receptor [Providencia rettgeri]|uniref:TonB-dependent receptor n=1 Tax=Providencia rettgeri TaxID=587 RepID=A0A939NI33_PRORE|nr:TonB-dependent receptor [Providencia rettgeri]